MSYRGVPTAVGDRDSRIEIATVGDHVHAAGAVLRHGVVVGPRRREMIGRYPEVAAGEPERRQDVLLDVGLPGISRDLLDDAREVDEPRVAVAVARAGRKQDLLIRHHGDELLPARRLERLPPL